MARCRGSCGDLCEPCCHTPVSADVATIGSTARTSLRSPGGLTNVATFRTVSHVSPDVALAAVLALAAAVNAPLPAGAEKKRPPARGLLVLAAAAQDPNEPAFVLACLGDDGKLKAGTGCKAPPPGTRARRPGEAEHTVGRAALALPCEPARHKRPAVVLEPPPPRGPFLAVWPSADAHRLTPASELSTRVPDPRALELLGQAVKGTPVIDQSLSADLDNDGKEDRLFAVRRAGGEAALVLVPGSAPETFRSLPLAAGTVAARLLAVSDLDKDGGAELFVFAQKAAGWELSVLDARKDASLATLSCAPR